METFVEIDQRDEIVGHKVRASNHRAGAQRGKIGISLDKWAGTAIGIFQRSVSFAVRGK